MSFSLCGPPTTNRSLRCTHTQLGSECRSSLHYRPPRHEPRQPSIQGCHPRMSLQSKTCFGTANNPILAFDLRVPPYTTDSKKYQATWCSSPDALQLRTLWNVSVLLHMPPSETLLTRLLHSSLPTEWIILGVSPSTETSSRSP
jgi:hypothetical protein